MSIIGLNTNTCQSCYKCIRECPLKAIEFKNNLAQVITKECVLCGRCVTICPRSARVLKDDMNDVLNLISSGNKVYLSLAPSWKAYFKEYTFEQMSSMLKQAGFAGVEETAIGAAAVTHEYEALMEAHQMKNIIVTACHSVVMLVERHYPSLIKYLAPVSSPMMAHARLMREAYGDIKVAFAGPCLSKMEESDDPLAGGMVNHALTFDNVKRLIENRGITPETETETDIHGVAEPVSRLYPKPQGIIATLREDTKKLYTCVSVDGLENCMGLFESLEKGEGSNLFIEANICEGGCVGGPIMRLEHINPVLSAAVINSDREEIDDSPANSSSIHVPHPRVFQNRKPDEREPSEEEIRKVLQSIGKFTKEDELNCSSCGYPTCRDKAIAVIKGKADISMCMPYLSSRAENISSTVIEHSPNAIIAFDDDLNVIEINPKAQEIYNVTREEAIGNFLPAFYSETGFEDAKRNKSIIEKKVYVEEINRTVEKSIAYIKEHGIYLVIVKDVSEEEARKEKLENMREHTIETAQRVIDKQMRVAQEIASLLGETTGETKAALTNLKRSIQEYNE